MSKEERRDYSRILSNGKRLKKRRAQGMKTRAEYLEANNLSRDEPWKAEGISRTTWYERRKKGRTGLAAIHKNNAHDGLVRSGHAALSKNAKVSVVEHGSSPTELTATPDPSNFNPILSWLCLRAAYHQQMNKICDQVANAEAA
jgi:hypothetical protein